MDIATALMNNLKAQNPYAAQGVNQANQMADQLQSEPYNDGFSTFLGNMGAGIAAAPSNVSTMQAIGQSLPGALQAMQNKSNEYMGRQKEALALRMTAANTLDAVKKYEEEKKFKEAQLGLMNRKIEMLDKHHDINSRLKMMELGVKQQLAAQKEKKEELKQYEDVIKSGKESQKMINHLDSETTQRLVKEGASNGENWLPLLYKAGQNPNTKQMSLMPQEAQIALTSDRFANQNALKEKRNFHLANKWIGDVAKVFENNNLNPDFGIKELEKMRVEIQRLQEGGVEDNEIKSQIQKWTQKLLRKNRN